MVTINILINQGIIGHANNAVRGYEVAEEKELIGLGYQNYKMDKLNESNAELTVDGATVAKDDEVNGWYITFTKTKHNYSLSDNGTIEETGERWVKDGDTFKLGDATVKVGDYIAYDPTKDANGNPVAIQSYTSYSEENASPDKNEGRTSGYTEDQTFNVNNYTGGWRVLGTKNGKLQLVSERIVGQLNLKGKLGYLNCQEELNSISSIYGKGKYSEGARSINVDDINQITGYDPNKTGDGKKYREGQIDEYGNEVTYYWKGDSYPYYVGKNGTSGNLSTAHNNGFDWHNIDGAHHVDISETASNADAGREKITAIKNTYYHYYAYSLTEESSTNGEKKGIATNSVEYRMLFTGTANWLASRCVATSTSYAFFGLYITASGSVGTTYLGDSLLWGSQGSTNNYRNYGVRPIVTLSINAKIKTDGTNDGSTQAKAYTIELDS